MDIPQFESMPWRIGFAYTDCDVSNAFELILPQEPWEDEITSIGGNDEAASGEQESFVIREDEEITVNLRFTETEWKNKLRPMLKTLWRQPQVFTCFLDVADVTTEHSVRLVDPWLNARPQRMDTFGLYRLPLKMRTAAGSVFSGPYFQALEDV